MSLPDEVEKALAILCCPGCKQDDPLTDFCEHANDEDMADLRLAIERAILLARVVERKITAAHHQCDGCGMAVDNLRAQADALKGGS